MNIRNIGHTAILTAASATLALCGLLIAAPSQAASFRWSGVVDDTATIAISGRDVRIQANKAGVREEREDFRGTSLPRRPLRVELREADGRGDIRLVQQPTPRNHFTAVVRIYDKQPGYGRYNFTLQWADDNDRRNNDDRHGGDGEWRRDHD